MPAQLQVYDKLQELKFKSPDEAWLNRLPKTLTRFEYRLGSDRVPIEKLIDIPRLLPDCHPFASIEFKEVPQYYDYKADFDGSFARRMFQTLSQDVGAQEAIAYLNRNRNFARNFRAIVIDNKALKREIEESFSKSCARLLSGKGASVKHIYVHCARCNRHGLDVKPCTGCGVRLCFGCCEIDQGHEQTCPKRCECAALLG
jgi:hypothetical protein